jgi:hypothetical protein
MSEPGEKTNKGLRAIGIFAILFAAVISSILAITVDMSHYELGALINWFWPPIVGVITTIVFLLVTWATKNPKYRIITIVFLCAYNLYVGFALHIEKEYWPFVLF